MRKSASLRRHRVLAYWLLLTPSLGCDSKSLVSPQITDPDGQQSKEEQPAGSQPTDQTSSIKKKPNILLLIADDMGLDASAQYSLSNDLPQTQILDSLAQDGIVFDNAWATPACTTTRGTIITGQHGIHSGVDYVPATLADGTQTLQAALAADPEGSGYSSAVLGKWHLGGGNPKSTHPNDFGVSHYAGNLAGTLDDYSNWDLTINGQTQSISEYHTSKITDLAIDWIDSQTGPWFAWVAYVAPHLPFHLPPAELRKRELLDDANAIEENKRDYYLAAIEAMDMEIGRLLASLPSDVRENTVIIFIGDNGTPRGVIDRSIFDSSHGKSTLYEGGIRVPFIVSGGPILRKGEREAALVNTTDLFATVLDLAGSTQGNIHDSQSFADRLTDSTATSRTHNYTEFKSDNETGWAARNERYKLIERDDGSQELFDIENDISESTNLINSGEDVATIIGELTTYADSVRNRDTEIPVSGSQNLSTFSFTNRSPNCAHYVGNFHSTSKDIGRDMTFDGSTVITTTATKCKFVANGTPNHDFNDSQRIFTNLFSPQNDIFEVSRTPVLAATPTDLSLTQDNAIMLNGVKVDLLAGGCFGVQNGKTGCLDINQPWRYNPVNPDSGYIVDSQNAHTQPDGAYHYHGPPITLAESTGDSESGVIGFAADGFPIYGPYIVENGVRRKVVSSYRLKSGNRPIGSDIPQGAYDGQFRDDYDYVDGHGDLDQCNGMMRDGTYGYYISDGYPYIIGCFQGTPDPSFNK